MRDGAFCNKGEITIPESELRGCQIEMGWRPLSLSNLWLGNMIKKPSVFTIVTIKTALPERFGLAYLRERDEKNDL